MIDPEQLDAALEALVADETLSPDQADAVRGRLADDAQPIAGAQAESTGYLGLALTIAGSLLLMAVQWPQLSLPGRLVTISFVAVILVGAGQRVFPDVLAPLPGLPRPANLPHLPGLPGAEGAQQRRFATVVWLAAAFWSSGAVVALFGADRQTLAAAVAVLGTSAVYARHRSVPSHVGVWLSGVLLVIAMLHNGGLPVMAVGWLLLAFVWGLVTFQGVLREQPLGYGLAAGTGVVATQLPMLEVGLHPVWYLMTLGVSATCLAAYADRPARPLLIGGVAAAMLGVAESLGDWTGRLLAGAAGMLLVAGVTLLAVATRRLHEESAEETGGPVSAGERASGA
ncbi:hypothetical protein BH24ACT13_BH24ACT13_15930 [soil metagenome]